MYKVELGMAARKPISVVPDKRAERAPIRGPYAAAAIGSAMLVDGFISTTVAGGHGSWLSQDDVEKLNQ